MSQESPKTFGRFEVVSVLGRGMAGEVYETRDASTGTRYVVKCMRPHVARHLDLARFMREAELMKRISHPNLMPVLHVEAEARPPYYVMPHKVGRTVSDRLREGRLAPSLVLRVARDACAGLAEAHRLGVVHRDVKPGNLFLESGGRTIVLDFGLARETDSQAALTAAGSILGTPAYMAPEQCRGEVVDGRADVYSLGVTIIELLLGKNPFAAGDIVETLRRHLEETPRRLDALLPHRVTPELGELVHRMIAKDPEHRPYMPSCLAAFQSLCGKADAAARNATRCTARPAVPAGR